MPRRSRFQKYLDARGPGHVPCPCCGHLTLHEGPGDYDVCAVCFWEDAGDQLRWPTLADGPNGISLVEGQRNFIAFGACDEHARAKVRAPRPGEEREPGWRPIDPLLDDLESGPGDPRNLPWPPAEELYWWRPTYFRRPENQRPGPAPRRPPANEAERMMARIIEQVPETEAVDVEVRSRWEQPAPFKFCTFLAPFVISAVQRGDTQVALHVVAELDAGLAGGDVFAGNCVAIGFLEAMSDRSPEMETFVETWPPAIRIELKGQWAHQEQTLRELPDGSFRLPLRWKLRHPILWWKMRRGKVRLAG